MISVNAICVFSPALNPILQAMAFDPSRRAGWDVGRERVCWCMSVSQGSLGIERYFNPLSLATQY